MTTLSCASRTRLGYEPVVMFRNSQNQVAPLALASNQLLRLADHYFQLSIPRRKTFVQANRSSAVLAVGCWADC